MKRYLTPFLALAIFVLNLLLNAPVLMQGETPFRGSILGGYTGMARFLSQHPNPWGWNPLNYCGLPTQFMYVPNLPYLSALFIHLLPGATPEAVFNGIVGLMTLLGPVTLFFFALYFTGNRRWAFIVAVAYSLLSASYTLFAAVDNDRGIAQMAWRIKVLLKYGEGPHNTGLTLLPLALIALWRAATSPRSYPRLLIAAILLAVIPLTNLVAAFALAISCLLMLLAAWRETGFNHLRVLTAGVLAYLLACFWLTPSFVKTILFNWPADTNAFKVQQQQRLLLLGMLAALLIVRALFYYLGGSFYFCYITLGAVAFGWIATAFYQFGIETIPESHRYAIEFEFFLALAVIEAIRLTLRHPNSTVRICAIGTTGVMLLVGSPQLWDYLTQGWNVWKPVPRESTVEYQLANWIAQHPPSGRVLASGGLRYRFNSWFDIPQIGGGFETGLLNRIPVYVAYHIRVGNGPWKGHEVDETLLEMKSLGTEYVVIHGPKSREYYRDFVRTERVATSLPAVFHIEDDTIYQLPVRSLAHVMKPEELPRRDPTVHPDDLQPYVAALEDPTRPQLQVHWTDSSALTVEGSVPPDHILALQVSADPGWRATQQGKNLPIDRDQLGFMILHPAPGPTSIELQYHGTLEQRIMAGLSALSWLLALACLFRRGTSKGVS